MKKLMGRTMMKMKDNRKNGRKALKGFTLVEIIVVLVILAILAAAMIPALTGYIDRAKERTLVAEARNAVTAAQTLASEAYGLGRSVQSTTVAEDKASSGYKYADMEELADIEGTIDSVKIVNGKVEGLIYKAKDATEATTDDKYIKYTRTGGFEELVDMSKNGVQKPSLSTTNE